MTKQTTFDLDEYARRTCEEICKYHAEAKKRSEDVMKESKFYESNYDVTTKPNMVSNMIFTQMHELHCINCPLECMMNLLREERDQNMKLTIEYKVEVV